jgi:hypothetical protein
VVEARRRLLSRVRSPRTPVVVEVRAHSRARTVHWAVGATWCFSDVGVRIVLSAKRGFTMALCTEDSIAAVGAWGSLRCLAGRVAFVLRCDLVV